MKKYLPLILLALVSCKGFLEEVPTTSLSEKDVYDSPQALEANINGCYLTLNNSSLWKGTMYEYFQTGSGLIIWGGNRTTDEWLDGMYFTKYSTDIIGNKNVWTAVWLGINRCNRLIDNLPDSSVDEGFKKEIEAEARLIRAHFYFTAVRIWGDVPLLTSSPDEASKLYNPRKPFPDVYAQVLEDLTFAEEHMRGPERAEEAAPGKNRPNKWAATALKASVYLTIGSLLSSPDDNFWDTARRTPDFSASGISTAADAFTLAYDTAVDVIENGPYSLAPDYRTLFRWTEAGDWFLPESILKITSSNKAGQNYCSIYMLPAFPEGSSNYATTNSNAGRVRPSRFAIENILKYSGGKQGTGAHNSSLYASTSDPRFAATFFVKYLNLNTNKQVTAYPSDDKVTASSDSFIKKYLDPTYDVTSGKADFYLMRLAEVYLIAAEAAASLSAGPGDNWWNLAIANVNVLRNRARHSVAAGVASVPADWKSTDFASADELVNAIMWERVIELMGEGHEWFDTHRRGATWLRDHIAAPANEFYMGHLPDFNAYLNYHFPGAIGKGCVFPTDITDLRKGLLSAYPESELRLNTAESRQNDFFWQ